LYKITYISDARIPSEMANSVSILNLCSTFSELGNEVNLLKRWRYQNRNVNIDDVFDMYGLQTKFNIVDIPNLDLSVLDNKIPKLFLKPLNYINKRIWEYYASNFVTSNFNSDFIYMRNNMPYVLNNLVQLKKFIVLEFLDVPVQRYFDIYKKSIKNNKNLVLLAITSNLADKISEIFDVKRSNIFVSSTGVNRSMFDFSKSKRLKSKKTVMYIGSLHPNRGVDNVILASKAIKNHEFIIIGGNKQEVNNIKNKHNIFAHKNLSFFYHQNHSQISKFYEQSDILVLPMISKDIHTRLYASPNKLFEYLASGKPIIASNIESLKEILRDGINALFFNPEDSSDLIDKINILLKDQGLADRLSKNALEIVDNYTWKTKAQNILSLIKEKI